jgi:hypothetical protein
VRVPLQTGTLTILDDLQFGDGVLGAGICPERTIPARMAELAATTDHHAASGRRTASGPPNGPNRPSPWPMLRNATVSEEDNHARFCSLAFRNRFHWWNG